MKRTFFSSAAVLALGVSLGGCESMGPKVDVSPVQPVRYAIAPAAQAVPTGSLFSAHAYRPAFEDPRARLPGDLVEHMHGPAKHCVQRAKAMAREKIFQDKRKTLHEIGAYTTLEILLNSFCGAALEQYGRSTPSFKNQRILDLLGNNAPEPDWTLYRAFLRVIDFIAGMTDSYATEMAREMTGRSSPS